MFLLRHPAFHGIIKVSSSTMLRKTITFGTYAWNKFPVNSHVALALDRSFDKLISRKCSNEENESREGVVSEMSDEAEGSVETKDEMFKIISNGDPEVLRQLQLLKFEIEVYNQTGVMVPTTIKMKDWRCLLNLKSENGRRKYLRFLCKTEKKVKANLQKKISAREQYLEFKGEDANPDPMSYNVANQCLLLRVYSKPMKHFLQLRNEVSQEIAQHVVFDCSYQEYMNSMNTKYCAMQLSYALNVSMYHHYPNYIRLCNFKKADPLASVFSTYVQPESEDFTMPVHEGSYLDLYPKKKLVYLTPHCKEPLIKPNPEDVYIIGAFVDRGCGTKASLAKAKKYNLRMARLPLDEYLYWKQGSKSLPLNIVLKILLDLRLHNNWMIALKNVPVRHHALDDSEITGFRKNDILI